MRCWSRREIVVGGVGLLLSACSHGQVGDVGYSLAVNRNDNVVAIRQEADTMLVAVESASGIGHASITWWGKPTPRPTVFLLRLSGLEQFSLRWAECVVNVSVNSTSQTVTQSMQMAHNPEAILMPDSPYWMDVTLPTRSTQEPSLFTIVVPAAFTAAAPNMWGIAWVDAYR